MIYLFNKRKQLTNIITRQYLYNAVQSKVLNGLYTLSFEVPITFTNKEGTFRNFKKNIDNAVFVGHFDAKDRFQLYKIHDRNLQNKTIIVDAVHVFFDDAKASKIIQDIRPNQKQAHEMTQLTLPKGWNVKEYDVTPARDMTFYYLTPLEARKEIIETFQVEFDYGLTFDGNKIISYDVYVKTKLGAFSGQRFNYGTNILSVEEKQSDAEIYTAVIGRGKGEEVGDGYGRRITFEDIEMTLDGVKKPKGQNYVEIPSATAEYGYADENGNVTPRIAVIEFDQIEDKTELLKASHAWLKQNCLPKVLYDVTVADLKVKNLDLGDSVHVIYKSIGLYQTPRVEAIEYNLLDLNKTQIKLGDYRYFKTDKVQANNKAQIERIENVTKDNLYRIKIEFNENFEAQKQLIKNEFDLAVTEATAQIEASEQRMTDEMSQMKLEQQQRVSEIYEDIGSINQTVSDVANKADYLDGVYTDLSTQTGEVSSTVANIIDGNAPAGSVLKQTIDGVIGRVWEQDIDSLNFENRNLLKKSNELYENTTYNIARYYFDADLKEGEEVTVSLKGQLGSDRTAFTLYNSGGYVFLVSLYPSNQKDGIYTATFKWRIQRDNTIAENKWLNVYQVANTGTTASKIEWIKLERGSKATPYSTAPEDLMKYTDIVARPDGFLIGSFEMGGDKIAQAILGKAGAIDLIADNVNLSNNLNVANQIKSLSLETVYANISSLRTRMLVADVITANMVKFDTALIEKFTSSTAFINSLTAKSAFINNVKAIDIDFNRATATGGSGSATLSITGDRILQSGKFNRIWKGVSYNYDVSTIMREGYIKFADFNREREISISAFGISTFVDGSGNQDGYAGSSGTISWWDKTYGNADGITISSEVGVPALKSFRNRVVLDAQSTVDIYSQSNAIHLNPNVTNFAGVNRFAFTVGDSSTYGRVGYQMFGAGADGIEFGSGLRFHKARNQPRISVVDMNFATSSATVIEAGIGEFERIDTRYNTLILGVSNIGEVRIQQKGTSTYKDLRIDALHTQNGNAFKNHSGTDVFFGVGGGTFVVTNNNGYNGGNITYRDIHFQNWKAHSHERSKYDIENWNDSVLDVFRRELQLKKYKLKSEIDLENQFIHRGIVIRSDSTEDEFPAEWRNGDGFNGNEVMWWNTKAIQELAHENDTLKSEIAELKSQINKIVEMIA